MSPFSCIGLGLTHKKGFYDKRTHILIEVKKISQVKYKMKNMTIMVVQCVCRKSRLQCNLANCGIVLLSKDPRRDSS